VVSIVAQMVLPKDAYTILAGKPLLFPPEVGCVPKRGCLLTLAYYAPLGKNLDPSKEFLLSLSGLAGA
jgi:hypothetical protein